MTPNEFVKSLRLGVNPTDVLANTKALFKNISTDASFAHSYTPEAPLLDVQESRNAMYKLWWAYFDNTIYNAAEDGGYRDIVNMYLGSAKIGNLAPLFNPVERAVRAYEYVFDGSFGEEITLAEEIDGEPVNPKIIEPINQIWKWSNINSWKNELLLRTACLGTSGLRIVYRENKGEKKIFLIPEHPSIIKFVERDERENITQIVLEYEKVEGDYYDQDNPRMLHRYVEYMSREKFWMTRDGSWWNFLTQKTVDTKEEATIKNRLGIVPYVLVTQTKIGSDFGVPCFYGKERMIDHLNALTAHINQQIRRHVTATWLIEGGGPKPKKIPMGDQFIWYVQKDANVGSQVSATDLVSKMDLGKAIQQQQELLAELTNAIPEMKATDGAFLSHQSGGTVAQLRLPAEQRILGARTNIEAAFVKAQQIALSLGILYKMWDLGEGWGSREIADKTYALGLENHKFINRSALPLTTDDKLTLSKARQAEAAAENPEVSGVQGGDNTSIPSTENGATETVSSTS
jgi:hypothetical protein